MKNENEVHQDRTAAGDEYSTNKPPARLDRLPAFILFGALGGAPAPFGSRDAATIAFWCGLLGLGLVLASAKRLRRPHLLLLAGIGLIVAGYAFVLHEQLADSPWIAAYHPIWAQASELLGIGLKPSVSIVRHAPFYALGPPLAAILALTLGLVVGTDRARARQAVLVVAWSGVGYASYGMASLLLAPTAILWREKTAYIGDLTGTFINRNTAASYFGSCAAAWLVLLLERARRRLPKGNIEWKEAPRQLLAAAEKNGKELVLPFAMLFLCLVALFLTRSRAGVVVSLFAMVLGFALFFQRYLPRGQGLAVTFVGGAAIALILLQSIGGGVSQRFELQGLADEGRLAAWRSTMRMIGDHPWFGTGLGTFAWAFPAYRSGEISMWGVWDRAHSTPLELAAEVGVPLAVAIAIGWLVILVTLWWGTLNRKRDQIIPLAAFLVAAIALLHSCVDFSLQVTGYAIVVCGLAGIGLAQSFTNHDRSALQARTPLSSQRATNVNLR